MNRRVFLAETGLGGLAATLPAVLRGAAARPRVRVAQIGTAHAHAAEKWAALGALAADVERVGLCEPDPERRERARGEPEYADAEWLDLEAVLRRTDVDAVLVETELPDLMAMAERVLAAGRHLHLDKPPGRDLAGFERLQRTANATGRVLQQGYMYRYHPAVRFCFEALARGWLGRPLAVHGEIGKAIGAARRPWLAQHYGGSMMLLGCHLIDLTVAALGEPQRVTTHRRRSFPERDEFHDHELAVLEYSGALATVRSLLAEVEGEERRQWVVCGENGTIEVRPLEPARVRVAFTRPPEGFVRGYQDVPLPQPAGRYTEQLTDFVRQVRGGASELPRFDAAHDRRVQAVLVRAAGVQP
jgi:predicted dehydrogenase